MDKRKEEIIEVALRRFSHYGFSKTTMNEIADDLSITKANLYYYYSDKTTLIKDVITHVSDDIHDQEKQVIDSYSNNLMSILYALLELRASFLRRYYVLQLNENMEWIKGVEMTCFLEEMNRKENSVIKSLFEKAQEVGELDIEDAEETSMLYRYIIKGLGVLHNIQDIITGIPNKDNVDKILACQKKATKLIFENRIVTK